MSKFINFLTTHIVYTIKSDEMIFNELYKNMYDICKKNNWGEPFSYARSKEIYMSNFLKHKISHQIF